MKTITFWAAAVAAVTFAFPAAAGKPADAWLTTKTKIALLADSDVDGTKINVDSSGGVVTLYGTLPDQAQQRRAVELARGIEGVTSVRDLTNVDAGMSRSTMAKTATTNDKRLRKDVEKALETNRLSGSSIKVASVEDGNVVLTGQADSLSDQRVALARARSVPGVMRVTDRISTGDPDDVDAWRPRSVKDGRVESRAGDAWITAAVKLRLLASEETPGLAINVDTDDGVVTLFGVVPTSTAKTTAEAEARKVEDVAKVVNALQIVPEDEQAAQARKDDEIKKAVRASFEADDRLDDANLDVEVKNGVVRLTGQVASHDDRVLAAQRARAARDVRSVRQELEVKLGSATASASPNN